MSFGTVFNLVLSKTCPKIEPKGILVSIIDGILKWIISLYLPVLEYRDMNGATYRQCWNEQISNKDSIDQSEAKFITMETLSFFRGDLEFWKSQNKKIVHVSWKLM